VVLAHGCAKVPQPPGLGPQDLLTAVDSSPPVPSLHHHPLVW
jgi:hypothetical protein